MKTLLIALFLGVSSISSAQEILSDSSGLLPHSEMKEVIEASLKTRCATLLKTHYLSVSSVIELEADEYDQGKVDYLYQVTIFAKYKGNDSINEEIVLTVKDLAISNPAIENVFVETLSSTAWATCK